ncbi:PAS domain-containing sensor histidine kinase [Massilia sp. TWR1-2-2]|uniref:PAS domain-containing sensor histidine kinase n=1 Tax=Massilia sp. TWR1-2-2 TaxID=2804584 RepID=UPI003CEB187C
MIGRFFGTASLARRFALAAAVLTASAIILVALASAALIRHQSASADALLRQREMAFNAILVGNNLAALSSRVAELANSPMLANALVDSAGKETYLTPFLREMGQINGMPIQLILTDFEGKEIATNGAAAFGSEEIAWLPDQLAANSERPLIVDTARGARLVGIRLLRYVRTNGAEGAVMYSVGLADLAPVDWAHVIRPTQTRRDGRRAALSVALDQPVEFATLGLRLEAKPSHFSDALIDPAPNYAIIATIALAMAGCVFLLASRLAFGLTRDLRHLDHFASNLGEEGIGSQRAELVGSIEVTSLARSIKRMLDRLYQQQLRILHERNRFVELANTIPQLAWIAEPDGTISWFNDRWYAYTGAAPAQMQDGGWMAWHQSDALPAVLAEWQAAMASGNPAQMTFSLRGADGRYRRFFTSVAPLRDSQGRIVQWFGTNTDLSQLEQPELVARRSEARLHQGMVAARMAVWDWDLGTGKVGFSANLSSVFGAEWNRIDRAWELVHPDDVAELRAAVAAAVATGSQYHAIVRVMRGADAPLLWADMRGQVGIGVDGGHGVVHAVAIDVTERMRAEEALRQADRSKDEFLAMLAHELRNPLAPISSGAELLKLGVLSGERAAGTGEVIARQVAHMTHLVNDLLDVSRVTRGLVSITAAPLDLRQVVQESVEQTRPLIDTRGHRLTVALPAEPVWVDGDHTRLVQVMSNLLNNSAKFTAADGDIGVALFVDYAGAVLTVRDNGSGISAQLLPNVFDLFTQGKRALDRSQGGLGLGLALVKKLIELHGGSVVAASAGVGHGSVMTITLPLHGERPPGLAGAA